MTTPTKPDALPTGYTCAHCGRASKFSSWVFAHWREMLIHTCECGARSEIICGRATLKYKPKKS